ncbi:MAG TPA: OmpA family protein [Lysobacter sp.]|nr:OmpA family protein [Lysobacter sp.]
MNTQRKYVFAITVMTTVLTACATGGGYYGGNQSAPPPQDQQQSGMNKTQKGALIGAAVGVAAGLLTGGDATERRQRALVGAGVGGLAGGAIGNYQDRQERALRERMAGTGVGVVRQGDNITLSMPGNVTFAFNDATLQPQFYPVLNDVARTLTEYNQTVVEVAGHTDSVGSDAYNQELSVRRANSVAAYLSGHGVMQQRLITVGAGESRPIATNETEEGRAQNRRVEITLVPVHG